MLYSVKRRRQIGGVNEAEAIEAFRRSRDHFEAGEPDSSDDSSSAGDGPPQLSRKKRRTAYLREKKLQAIMYIASTNMPKRNGKIGEIVPVSLKHFHDRYERGDFTVVDRRVILTFWVAEAWLQLHEKYKHVIIKTFRLVGLSLNPDGSEDTELKVKGLPNIKVGDYSRKEPEDANRFGSLTAVNIAAV
ncbi:hypothetical protein V8E51_017677 [Hyaloscypha variabilis]